MGIQLVKCTKCGAPMIKRDGKWGQFYGCTTYPRCTNTMSLQDAAKQAQQVTPKKEFKPSQYQLAIFDFIKDESGNALIEAVAGSGKTTTIVKALELTPKNCKVIFLAFNYHIKEELARRAPSHVRVQTLHSLGLKALTSGLPHKPEVDDGKLMGIIKEFLPDYEKQGHLRSPLAQMVSLAKGTLVDPESREALTEMAFRFGIDMNGDAEILLTLVPQVMQVCAERTSVIDYDDMIWLPIHLNLHLEAFDYLFVDECQDLNASQIELLLRSVRPHTGRVIAVGDRRQSIYGFRGADINAIPRMIEALQAKVLPLSITYRCPVSHVDMAKEIVPQIEAAADAKMGTIEYTTYMKALAGVQDNDLVLCRVNAPLISMCYTLIKQGKKAVIRGRDIGKNLISFIDKLQPVSIVDLMIKVGDYQTREVERLTAAGKEGQVQSLQDKCDCVRALCDGIRDLSELRQRISTIFDDETRTGVILSSVHRAKGDESNRVWILKPELMPHPMATQDWQVEQEQNIRYVALTRSKDTMIFVQG